MGRYERYRVSNLRAYGGARAASYDASLPVTLLRVWELDDFVLEELGSDVQGSRVLDVGCGTGRLLVRLARAGAAEVCGADVAPAILGQAREKLGGVSADLRVADAEAGLPWRDGSFDAVVTTGAFHHFTRPLEAATEMRRVLKPGGALILADACFFRPLRQLMNALLFLHPREGDFRFRAPKEARRILSKGGLEVNLVRRLNWWSYGIVCVRPHGPDSVSGTESLERGL